MARPTKAQTKAARLAEAAHRNAQQFDNPQLAEMFAWAIQHKEQGNADFLKFLNALKAIPVPIEEFLDSPQFLGSTDLVLWPQVRKTIIQACQYWWKGLGNGAMKEILLTGATGTGKSEIAKVITAYTLHIIGSMKSVQSFFGLPSATGVVIPIQAAKPHVTKKVVYMPLRKYIEQMPWFQRNMKPSKLVESEMYFEKQNIRVVPVGSESDSILGEAIIAGIVDEINFMNVVEQSKRAALEGGRSGTYDQAQTVYDALTKRRKGRFITRGPHVGIMCISSSRRYRGDFTDRRQAYVEESREEGVLVYDLAQYEARPSHLFSGPTFRVALVNEAMGDIRIIEEDNVPDPKGAVVYEVPVEYLDDFKKDPSGSVRDIIGKSTHAITPFFRKRTVIEEFFANGAKHGVESILHKDNVVLGIEGMPRVKRDSWCQDPSKPRYVHIDLSATGDRCGVAMVRYDGMVERSRRSGVDERLPSATVEIACTIEPDHASEIDIAEVRTWVKQLKDVWGYPIKAVTYDGWNSLESRQQWRKSGMKTGLVSVDKTSVPYKQMREAMGDGRLRGYMQTTLHTELVELEYDEKKDKVDHPPSGSKDCADAVCGAYNNLLSRSSTWVGSFSEMTDPRLAGRIDLEDRFMDDRPE